MDLVKLLAFAVQNGASDLHISGGYPPILRLNGELKPLAQPPLTGDAIKAMVATVMTETQRSVFETEFELDFGLAFGSEARFRVNLFMNAAGAAGVFRLIPTRIPALAEIKAPALLSRLAELERGLILVTGPTGSGKSTTLAAMIDHINTHQARHILTIEDPVEFVHPSKRSLINHRELGRHTKSFARALKSALREDPDVILVGEMRDHETIQLALTAAETGHLVLGTLHTSSAARTVDRIIDVFPAGDKELVRTMLASSLEAVIAQVLMRRADGKGRVAAHEILVATPAVRNLIRENKLAQLVSMMQMGQRFGMQTLADAVNAQIDSGAVSREEGKRMLAVAAGQREDKDDATASSAAAGGTRATGAAGATGPSGAAGKTGGYRF